MTRHIYKPMLAKAISSAFSDTNWLFEIKWDGFRAIAYVETPFSLKSRNNKELKNTFPELTELTHLTNSNSGGWRNHCYAKRQTQLSSPAKTRPNRSRETNPILSGYDFGDLHSF